LGSPGEERGLATRGSNRWIWTSYVHWTQNNLNIKSNHEIRLHVICHQQLLKSTYIHEKR
jgi:hypothetical protein